LISSPSSNVFGLSDDRTRVYTLAFLRDTQTDEIRPLIASILPQERYAPFCYIKRDGSIAFENPNHLTPEYQEEMAKLISIASKIEIN